MRTLALDTPSHLLPQRKSEAEDPQFINEYFSVQHCSGEPDVHLYVQDFTAVEDYTLNEYMHESQCVWISHHE